MVEKTSFMAPASGPESGGRRAIRERQEPGAFERMMDSVRKRWNREPHAGGRMNQGSSPSRDSLEDRLDRLRERDEQSERVRSDGDGSRDAENERASTESTEEANDAKKASSDESSTVTLSVSGEDVAKRNDNEESSEGDTGDIEMVPAVSGASDEASESVNEREQGSGSPEPDEGSGESAKQAKSTLNVEGEAVNAESSDHGDAIEEPETEQRVSSKEDTSSSEGDSEGDSQPTSVEAEAPAAGETNERGESERKSERPAREGSVRTEARPADDSKRSGSTDHATPRPDAEEVESTANTADTEESVAASKAIEEVGERALKGTREAFEAMMKSRQLRENKFDARARSESHLEKFKGDGDGQLTSDRIDLNLEGDVSGSRTEKLNPDATPSTGSTLFTGIPASDVEEASGESSPSLDFIREWVELRGGSQQVRSSIRLDQMPVANLELRRQILPSLTRAVSRVHSGDPTRQGEWQKHQVTLDDGQKLNLLARQDGDLLQLKLQSSNPELNRLLVEHQQEIRQHLEKECGIEIDLQFEQSEDPDGSQFEEWMESESSTPVPFGASGGRDTENDTTEAHTRIRSFGYNRMEWTG